MVFQSLTLKKYCTFLKCKVCGEAPYVGKAKNKFRYRFNTYKSKYMYMLDFF